MKVKLTKDYPKTVGDGVWEKGTELDVTPEFYKELVEGGFVESSEPQAEVVQPEQATESVTPKTKK